MIIRKTHASNIHLSFKTGGNGTFGFDMLTRKHVIQRIYGCEGTSDFRIGFNVYFPPQDGRIKGIRR